jgi:ribosomal protein S18 acetylase RimI-like enzyme
MNRLRFPPSSPVLRLVGYDPSLKSYFYSINREWLEEYFSVTEEDEKQLRNPEAIVAAGGQVFFVLDGPTPVGTCALVLHGDGSLELVKMGVLKAFRGRGAGRLLMDAVLAFAAAKKAYRITLETAAALEQAIRLYTRYGFEQSGGVYTHPLFGRAIFRMERTLHS